MEQEILLCINDIDETIQESNVDVMVSIYQSLVKSASIYNEYNGESLNGFAIFQEGSILDDVKKRGKNDNAFVKAIKFLPRLLMAIVDAIRKKFSKKHQHTTGVIKPETLKEAGEKDSSINKALKAIGVVSLLTTGGVLAFRLYQSQESTEFKDDVGFTIAKDGSQLRIIFPFYKIEGTKEFNKQFKNKHDITSGQSMNELNKLFDLVVTNQSRLTERDFTIESWDKYYEDEIKKTYNEFGDNLKKIAEEYTKDMDQVSQNETMQKVLNTTADFLNKINKDIDLISKFDDKLHKTLDILMHPEKQNIFDKHKLSKITFEPVPIDKYVDIYNIDTTHLNNIIKYINDRTNGDGERTVGEVDSSINWNYIAKEIEKQFNCKIHGSKTKSGSATNIISAEIIPLDAITFSPKRGFDLSGAQIRLYLNIGAEILKTRGKYTGQQVCAVICHEVFHNISASVRSANNKVMKAVKTVLDPTIGETGLTVMGYAKKVFNKFSKMLGLKKADADKFEENCNMKMNELFGKQKDVNIAELDHDNFNDFETISSTKKLKATVTDNNISVGLTGAIGAIIFSSMATLGGVYGFIGITFSALSFQKLIKTNRPEEMMCDVCAAMYKLPVRFPVKISALSSKSDRNDEDLNYMNDEHPTRTDRMNVSYDLAKEMLYSGKIHDDETKEYLKWIVDRYEGLHDVERHLTKGQLKRMKPQFTSNINRAITNYLNDNNIKIKE